MSVGQKCPTAKQDVGTVVSPETVALQLTVLNCFPWFLSNLISKHLKNYLYRKPKRYTKNISEKYLQCKTVLKFIFYVTFVWTI